MSTKLYDGIILNILEGEFWNSISQIRETMENVFQRLNIDFTIENIKQAYIETATNKYRSYKGFPVQGDKEDNGLFFNVLSSWKSQEDFFKDKLRCKVQVYQPLEDGRVLGYVFTNNEPDYYKSLLELPFVEEFGYWNNTDKPDELSEGEWSNRFNSWDTILDRSHFLTGSGFSVELPETKQRTLLMPDEDFLNELNKSISSNDESWQKALSTRLVAETVVSNLRESINSEAKEGSMMRLMNIIRYSTSAVQNSEIMPVSKVNELTLDDLMAADTHCVEFPEVDEEILSSLVAEVEQKTNRW